MHHPNEVFPVCLTSGGSPAVQVCEVCTVIVVAFLSWHWTRQNLKALPSDMETAEGQAAEPLCLSGFGLGSDSLFQD